MSTSDSPPVDPAMHAYVPGACAFTGCGRSPAVHAAIAREAAVSALAASPFEARRTISWLRAIVAAHLRTAATSIASTDDFATSAGLVQEHVLPSLAPRLHERVAHLAALSVAASDPVALLERVAMADAVDAADNAGAASESEGELSV